MISTLCIDYRDHRIHAFLATPYFPRIVHPRGANTTPVRRWLKAAMSDLSRNSYGYTYLTAKWDREEELFSGPLKPNISG